MAGVGQQRIPTAAGVSLWLDGLDRRQLVGGEFARMIRDRSITGVTTNPATLRAAVLGHAEGYAAELADCRARGFDAGGALRAVAAADVRLACDDLRHVFDHTGGTDGYASLHVDPRLADQVAATVADARSLTRLVDRPNVMVGIPATDAGLDAITTCLAEGISANATLITGMRRYAQVVDAFMDGLESLRLVGGDLGAVSSVASLALGGGADPRVAYSLFARSLHLPRWSALAAAGARPQRLLSARPATSDPTLRATTHVAAGNLIVAVSPATLSALERGATLAVRWADDGADPEDVLDAGVDDIVPSVEREEIRGLTAAWLDAVAAVEGIAASSVT